MGEFESMRCVFKMIDGNNYNLTCSNVRTCLIMVLYNALD